MSMTEFREQDLTGARFKRVSGLPWNREARPSLDELHAERDLTALGKGN